MSELKNKINFTVACVDEFAQKNNLSVKEAFQYLFQFKGIEFIKENYEAEHTLSFDTVLEDLGILCRRNGGKLCHGSNTGINSINLAMCRPYKDFGIGFYLTDIREQAERMAVRVAKIYGGSPVLNVFDIQDDFRELPGIKIKDFGEQTTEEWARFVMKNRNHSFDNIEDILCNQDNKYDIVIGPVADDNMALLFRQYENEIIDFQTLLKGMVYKKTSSQYSFHTEKSIRLLRKVED